MLTLAIPLRTDSLLTVHNVINSKDYQIVSRLSHLDGHIKQNGVWCAYTKYLHLTSVVFYDILKYHSIPFVVYISKGQPPIPEENLDRIVELIEPWFIFSLIWTVGATINSDGRKKYSAWLREKMKKENVSGR